MTNFSRYATKVATKSFQVAATAINPPSKKEDYIETKGLFISKSFLIKLFIVLIAAGCLIYFLIWPFLLSRFFTAHFWQGNEKVEDWSGKVVVYYDEEKEIPKLSGKLEEGVLQGKGKLYDENGLLVYEGGFVDGLKSGKGTAYEAGVVIYEGGFSDDRYNGAGVLYEDGMILYEGAFQDDLYHGKGTVFKNGTVLYEGEFQEGIYSGEGTLYSEDGVMRYKGGFADGVPNGEGVSYYADGERSYAGGFTDGVPDGEGISYYPNGEWAYAGTYGEGKREGAGTAYREDGTLLYKGEFSQDLYSGHGTLYLEDGRGYIESTFTDGTTDGYIDWYIDGKLWYSGGAEDLIPDGYGEIYLKNGDMVYAGEMDRGTIDGQWLLSLTAEEVRQAFAQATVVEKQAADGGFFIINRELGMVVRCSYQSEDSDNTVFSAWISRQGYDLVWKDQSSFVSWADSMRDETDMTALFQWEDPAQFRQWAEGIGEVLTREEYQEHDMRKERYNFDGWHCTAAIQEAESLPIMVSWTVEGALEPYEGADFVSEGVGQVREQMEALFEALEGVSSGAGESGEIDGLLELVGNAADAGKLVNALLDVYENDMILAALESSRTLVAELAARQQELVAQGAVGQDEVDAVLRELDQLDLRIAQCTANREKGLLVAENLAGDGVSSADLSKLLTSYDPVELDMQALCQAAADFAEETAVEGQQVDRQSIDVEVKASVINLTVAYQNTEYAKREYEAAVAAAEKTAEDYARSSVDLTALYQAQCAQNDASVAFYTSVCSFARLTDELNRLTGGELSRQTHWLEESYPAVFERHAEAVRQAAEEKEDEETVPADGGQQ